ncbi:biotin carboxyl carrier protein of acetyl-CoA carboxylase 1, chloroplastic-like [Olea europaea var. sylvestris]|uniref:biotin carboxyl carrier protein of acetyl-CoA carboxylase 1, chloroplastic-like n=1 Tax=Olea europaea var. sylvestris TaxID=158386 RepID=UPI000C1D2DF7|nr:biotin carboxyl carrier protein of acetyl-CoA carboxylase 1, chloroplastic-like [Olea europaea var. sylvestris]
MATSFGATTPSSAPVVDNARKSTSYLPLYHRLFFCRSHSKVPKLCFSSQSTRNSSLIVRAQSNEGVVGGSSKAAVNTPVKSEVSVEPSHATVASEELISEFITQLACLIKLVDSKDIVELELKQLDFELSIHKKDALPPPPSAHVTTVQSYSQPAILPPVPTPSTVLTPAPSPVSTASPSPPKTQISKSSHPLLKCPMAGTFYRSPAPGEPPLVKVGDKVQKGQVLCIIEAMKLMNEIEADQSGTIVEILVEDGKPVSVDTPLFAIEP